MTDAGCNARRALEGGKHDRASELRAIADGRLLLNVRNGVTVSRSMLAMIADELDAATAPPDVDGLVKRLRETHTCDGCGEYAGSIIHDLCDEAATALSSERAAHEQTKRERDGAMDKAVECYAKQCAAETRLAEVEKALNEAADALDAAMEDVEHWGAYAGEYFQDKHDLDGDLARIAEQATAARRALEGGE